MSNKKIDSTVSSEYIEPSDLDLLHKVLEPLRQIYQNVFAREEMIKEKMPLKKLNKASFEKLKLFLRKYGLN